MLSRLGIPFQVEVSDASEEIEAGLDARAQAVALAERKALTVAARPRSGVVLGADTLVVLDGDPVDKPRDAADAASRLRALSGRTHNVVTGLALVDTVPGTVITSSVTTIVRFKELSDDEITRYVASGEPNDKAGAYGIQGIGWRLIAGFDGCYTNVVGLPLCETAQLLKAAGLFVGVATPVCRLPDGARCPRLV